MKVGGDRFGQINLNLNIAYWEIGYFSDVNNAKFPFNIELKAMAFVLQAIGLLLLFTTEMRIDDSTLDDIRL